MEINIEIRPVKSRHGSQLVAGSSILLDCILTKLFDWLGMWQTGASMLMLGCSQLHCAGISSSSSLHLHPLHLASWVLGWVAQKTCRTEAYALLGMWH